MVNTEIFLGSGASVTLVPEIDIYLEALTVTETNTKLNLAATFTNNFSLVNNLYVGCVLEFYDAGVYTSTHRITANTDTTITFHPAISSAITVAVATDYFHMRGYGSPCPAPKVTSGTTYTASTTTVNFTSDLFADYDDTSIVFSKVPTSSGTTATDSAVWFKTASQTYGGSVSPVGEADISGQNTREEYAVVFVAAVNALANLSATRNGAVVTVTNEFGGVNTATVLYELDGSTAIANTGITATTTLGTTTATTIGKRLNSDNWLGLVDSLTFPPNEVEVQQKNLFVGGSRNFTHQYKGIETAGGASIGVTSNHGAWLYYFLGKAAINLQAAGFDSNDNPSDNYTGTANKYYIDNTSLSATGPLFYRSIGTVICPPILRGSHTLTDVDMFVAPTITAGAIVNPIEYTFSEQEGTDLPSFTLEQSFSKLSGTDKYRTNTADSNEDLNFVLLATGNRVNSLSITANENEAVKMTIDALPRKVHSFEKTESYDARRGVTDNRAFTNYSDVDTFLEPFFFSSGTISMFGQNFLRITNLTIKMDNSLTPKRYVGMGSRAIQDHVPAQRMYEITFTAMVTDDLLYNELVNAVETTTAGSIIDIIFDKANGEQIRLKFNNYFLTNNTWPIPEDKGAVLVEATVKATTLSSCTVKTHWVLQG